MTKNLTCNYFCIFPGNWSNDKQIEDQIGGQDNIIINNLLESKRFHPTCDEKQLQLTTSTTTGTNAGSASKMISADSYLPHTGATSTLPPPPPTYSRLPPDGHEFPPEYRDPSSTNASMFAVSFTTCGSNI